MKKTIILALLACFYLTACATATRGTKTLLVVNTTPTGASVTTDLETKQSAKLRKSARRQAVANGTADALEFSYRGCAPTPCGIEVPRKSQFNILVSKEGFISQTLPIEKIHRKDVTKKNAGKAGLATGVAAGAGAGTAVAIGGAAVAAPVALIFAAPIAVIGGTSLLVDAGTGANYDLTPNPVDLKLQSLTAPSTDGIADTFYTDRKQKSLSTKPKPKKGVTN